MHDQIHYDTSKEKVLNWHFKKTKTPKHFLKSTPQTNKQPPSPTLKQTNQLTNQPKKPHNAPAKVLCIIKHAV